MRSPAVLATYVLVAVALAGGCGGIVEGPQSVLDPAGTGARDIATLWWWMAGGALVVWIAVVGTAVYAMVRDPDAHGERAGRLLIVGGGAVFPTVVLGALLFRGLGMMPDLLAPGTDDSPVVRVTGEMWWWRVVYELPDGRRVEGANEVRLPVDVRTELRLESADVIHSFWIPALGGKMDMIPGRENRLALEPVRTGSFRGACGEYCGASHAYMRLHASVMEQEAFEAWLEEQAAPAAPPSDAVASRGRDVFLANGCGACHTVRGTPADGVVGPDLTHVGSRPALAAGLLPRDTASFRRWIAHPGELKPAVGMPSYAAMAPRDLRALSVYLEGLK